MKRILLILGAGLICLMHLTTANANVILTYTGNDFTTFTSPYTGTDKVTASITLASPLGDNLNLTPVTPLTWSLSDGEQTFTNASDLEGSPFRFSTDSTGTITLWNVGTTDGMNGEISTQNEPTVRDFAEFRDFLGSASTATPGTWTSAVQPVPAPPLSNLAAFGVLGLAFLWRSGRQIFGLDRAQ
jgi:hypothetical protein